MDKELNFISLNRKAWNIVAEIYNRAKYSKTNPAYELFCKKLPEGGSILDIGSGTGLPFAKLFLEKGFNYLGIDISSQMIKIARKNVTLAKFKVLSMTDLNYTNEFDGIFSHYSMLLLNPHFFKDVAKRVVKSLKGKGLFYLSLNEPRVKNTDLDEDVICEIMGETMYSRAYTEEEILNVVSPLGLKSLEIYREVQNSKEFGLEYMLVFVFQKIG
ncbi:MAG: class I SAM-dependent methyltransferase [Candidatus Lokiarchaeota archaeon]|nr:class I SAM-dependent methyltransferase [Candidatus Lokiarchaeota archaeon]